MITIQDLTMSYGNHTILKNIRYHFIILNATRSKRMQPPALRAGDSGFASTLARGLSLLAAFRPGEIWLSNAELARRTGLSRPTVSRLGATLVELGKH